MNHFGVVLTSNSKIIDFVNFVILPRVGETIEIDGTLWKVESVTYKKGAFDSSIHLPEIEVIKVSTGT